MRTMFNKMLCTFLVITCGWLVAVTSAQAEGDPAAILQSVADNMVAGLKANKATLKTKPSIVFNLAYKYVVPHASLPDMAKAVLPPRVWNSASIVQRARFQKEFTNTLIRTYASALTSYQDQTVKVYPVRGAMNGKSVTVNSEIVSSESDPIRVSYNLIRVGNTWKLYDLSVEGVDMLDSFRSQFADILSSGSMAELLNRMSAHNAR